ncbi:protein N-lysine methyltransferase family protein [Niabella sp. W65]|jgi:predicted nicotinamide N-methyase|nr:protein N-lysine methyltransferase family protein [Niabella sp. W65]MCH7367387.1 protein N-lysine methyltransferase family protein [Niabella sp. W65]ULT43655.1 protein N-lysine methyltransferase family protein [Niabella sp. I65]
MLLPKKLEAYFLNDQRIEIYIPEEQAILDKYRNNKDDAYWAQVWPAAIGLCLFLEQYTYFIRNKQILELAAGLGLPGLYTASLAQQVTITDKEPLSKVFVQQSALHLGLKNVITKTLNWKDALQEPLPELVLLSDVNYEPAVFEELKQVLLLYLTQKVPVIISTPQRLVAREFIMELMPYSSLQWNCIVPLHNKKTGVSIFVLEREALL